MKVTYKISNNGGVDTCIKIEGENELVRGGHIFERGGRTNGTKTFISDSVDYHFPKLKYGDFMFSENLRIQSVSSNLSSLIEGNSMFYDCYNLKTVVTELSALKDGGEMFRSCDALTSFTGNMKNLEEGDSMFESCESLCSFNSPLSSLISGEYMFIGCVLDATSVQKILTSIKSWPANSGVHKLGLGVSTEGMNKFAEITGTRGNCTYKGWTITITEN